LETGLHEHGEMSVEFFVFAAFDRAAHSAAIQLSTFRQIAIMEFAAGGAYYSCRNLKHIFTRAAENYQDYA